MDLPEYQLRIISDSEAAVFRVSFTDQRRIRWERCGRFSMTTGALTMQDATRPPKALTEYCDFWMTCVERARIENGTAYKALKAMGLLAQTAGELESPIDGDLFELLIWSSANMKDVLIANKGLAMLATDDQEKYILQGQHYMNEGRFERAEAEFLKALKSSANRAYVYSFLAMSLHRQGKAPEAASAIDQSISGDSRGTKFLVRGAQYNLEAGHLEKAQTYINKLAKKQGASDAEKLQVSRLAMRAKLPALGKELAEAVVGSDDQDTQALEHLVNIVATTEGEAEVFNIVRQHIKAMPATPRLKEWYVRSLIASNELERALQATKDWIAGGEAAFQAQFQRGRTYLAMKKPRSAMRALTAAAAISPNHAPTQKLIADACIFLGDMTGAVEASEKACKIDPQNNNFKNQAKRITDLILEQSNKKT